MPQPSKCNHEETTVIDLLKQSKKPLFTFELLPPLKGHSIERIYRTIESLLEYSPAYINFTSHRNEVVLAERPDGLLEKRVTLTASRYDSAGRCSEVQVQCDCCASPAVRWFHEGGD